MEMIILNLSLYLHVVFEGNTNMTYPEITAKLQNVTSWLNELNLLFKEKDETFIKLDKNSLIKRML